MESGPQQTAQQEIYLEMALSLNATAASASVSSNSVKASHLRGCILLW